MGRREELSRFLKTARGRIDPEEAGLPRRERRRAKGLSRDEVALLSGMSITWYTWFEQGRDVQLSAPTLERLSTALRLPPREREFLFSLAQHRPPPLTDPTSESIPPSVQHMMDSLSIPALVLTQQWTVIAWNRLVSVLFRDYADLPSEERNLFRILLLNDMYRRDPEEYREMVQRITARLKWDYSQAARMDSFDRFIEDMMSRSDTFRECWETSEIAAHLEGIHTASVPGVGDITFRHTSYSIEQEPGLRLVLFAPMDARSTERLHLLDD
ncbi:MAG TPA: helix-turn-helix transcriptional regulator [Sphingomonadaceae bacterium]|nr:helix-turn-helix transcriptional regulator [Sphingomonadaceae bacterium]